MLPSHDGGGGSGGGVNMAPIAPAVEFPFPASTIDTSRSTVDEAPKRSSEAERNDVRTSRPAPRWTSLSMTTTPPPARDPTSGRPMHPRRKTFWATSGRDGHRRRDGANVEMDRGGARPSSGRRPTTTLSGKDRGFSYLGPYPGFSFANEHFKARGKVSQHDGRLGISINDTNTGYLAKALGAGLDHHLGRHQRGEQESEEATTTHPPPRPSPPTSRRTASGSPDAVPIRPSYPTLNVVIMIVGSRGDIQPFMKIGRVLKDDYGHRVRIATHPAFRDFVEKDIGLEFFSVGGDPAELMAFMVKNPGLIPSMEAVKTGEVGRRREQMFHMFQGFWRACINATEDEKDLTNLRMVGRRQPFVADAIIANPACFAHIHCAERLGVPLHLMFTFPQTPTTEFPNPLATIKRTNIDVRYTNFMSYPLVEMIIWQGLGDLVNKFRVETLGLDALSTLWAPGQLFRQKVPFSYLWSPGLVPKPHDWGPEIDVAGFVFLDLARSFQPPDALVDFLDRGPPPVYIGFGSIVVDDPDRFTAIIFEAVARAGVRALVSKGWGGLGVGNVPDDIFLLDNTPHDWIFPRVRAVVHHGGAGTTAIGLKCGKPTMIVPFFGDQPFWGAMIAKAGAGYHEPVPYKFLTVDKLVDGIRELLRPDVQANAHRLARDIGAEGDGATNAVERFHHHLPMTGERSMRCSILDDRVAVWSIKKTSFRLSALAADVLVQQRRLHWRNLRLIRHHDWNDFSGPGEPLTGAGSALFRSVAGVAKGVGAVPVKLAKGARRYQKQRASRGSLLPSSTTHHHHHHQAGRLSVDHPARPARPRAGPEGIPSSNAAGEEDLDGGSSSSDDSFADGPPPDRDDHAATTATEPNLARDVARDVGKSLGKSGEVLANAPMEIFLALAQGLHNAPRLYGDSTVRRPTRVNGLHSGLRAAGEEFVYGIYDGTTGLVLQPYRGAKNQGVVGLFKGVGKGLGGFVLKDLAAVIGPFGYTLKGIHKELGKRKQPTHFLRRSRIQRGRIERQELSPDDEKAILRRIDQGWTVYQDMCRFVNGKKKQGLRGRFQLRREEKRWRERGAFDNVDQASKALQASKAEDEDEEAKIPDSPSTLAHNGSTHGLQGSTPTDG